MRPSHVIHKQISRFPPVESFSSLSSRDLVSAPLSGSLKGERSIEVLVGGHRFDIVLSEKRDAHAPGARHTTVDAHGTRRTQDLASVLPQQSRLYHGWVRNARDFHGFAEMQAAAPETRGAAHLRLSLPNAGIGIDGGRDISRARDVRGIIAIPGNDTYVLEPAANYFAASQRRQESMGDVVFFSMSHIAEMRAQQNGEKKKNAPACAGTLPLPPSPKELKEEKRDAKFHPIQGQKNNENNNIFNSNNELKKRQTSGTSCSVVLVADALFTNDYIGDVSGAVLDMVETVQGVDTVYRSSGLPGFQVSGTVTHTASGSDPFTGFQSDPSQFLGRLNTLRSTFLPAAKCAVHGFTFVDYSGTVGMAYSSAVCNTGGGAGMLTAKSFNNPQSLGENTIVSAHEFGHNYGATHDDNLIAGQKTIMAASGATSGNGQFSAASIAEMQSVATSKPQSCFAQNSQTGICGNGVVDDGEECDCGSNGAACASTTCNPATCQLLGSSFQCSSDANECCDAAGNFLSSGTQCGVSPYKLSWLPRPQCTGNSSKCPDCWPSKKGHPCWSKSNLEPCDGGPICATYCQVRGTSTCQPASAFGVGEVDDFLPDGTCCTGCTSGRCSCNSGSCGDCALANCGLAECGSIKNGCGLDQSCGSCPANLPSCVGNVCGPNLALPPGVVATGGISVDDAASDAGNWFDGLDTWAQVLFIVMFVVAFCCCVICLLGGFSEKKRRR
jgi:Metallo-peptidase family M12